MPSKSVSHTAEFEISRPIQTVFPLFSPEGEKLWALGWDYEAFIEEWKTLIESYLAKKVQY